MKAEKYERQVFNKKGWSKIHLRHLLVLLIPVLFLMESTNAQTEFLSEMQKQQVYYDSMIGEVGVDSMQGTGYKQYQRWFRYWAPKLTSTYDYEDYQDDLLDYAGNYSAPTGNGNPNWKLIGPNDVPYSGNAARGTGQIHYLYKDPDQTDWNVIYACSPVGGLFKSDDYGEHWYNLGTDKGLPKCGVSSIVIDKRLVNAMYISTGNGEGFNGEKAWQTAIGVWRSKDDGENWECIGLQTDTNGKNIYHMRKIIELKDDYMDSTQLIVTTTEGLFHTIDGYRETPVWDEIIDGEFYDVVQDPDNDNIIYASGSDTTGIYKYNLSTGTATHIFDVDTVELPYDTLDFPELRRISIKITELVPDTSYLFAILSMRDGDYTIIYRYNMLTDEWHKFDGGNFRNGYARKLGWDISPVFNDSNQIMVYGQNVNIMSAFYNGLNDDNLSKVNRVRGYNSTRAHDDFHFLIFEDSTSFWAGTDGGVFKGELINDTLVEWTAKNSGLGVATIEFIDAKYGLVTSGQFDCGSYIYNSSNNDEASWNVNYKYGGDGFQNIINSGTMYHMSAYEGGVVKIKNDNLSQISIGRFAELNTSCALTGDTIPYANFATYYANVDTVLYAVGQKEVMRYPDSNGDWEEWSNFNSQIGCAISGTWRVDAVNDSGTHQIYASTYEEAGGYQHLYKSVNGGGNHVSKWVKVNNTPNTGWIKAIKITGNPDSVLVSIHQKVYAVNAATPASPTWYDLTFNLDAGEITSIDYDGTNIWVGTERGVYYMDTNEDTSWNNYTANLPNCEVKDIEVNDKRVYAGTYGRGVWFSSTPSCGNIGANDTIKADQTYSGDKDYYNDIIITAGNILTITGTVRMASDCKIVVERGAKLVVDGGTLTKACPDLWLGVEVRGSSNSIQDTIHQGWVILKNGATIEYAKQGVATIKNDNNTSYLTYAGGVIQADSAIFKNNEESIVFFPYPERYPTFAITNNKSYFKKSMFVTDSNFYYFSDVVVKHVLLDDVLGVLFENNTFTNTADDLYVDYDDRGIGIEAWSAGFLVYNNPVSTYGNIFDKMHYGIKAYAYANQNRLIDINGNTFRYNHTGCYLGAETNANLVLNTFKVQSDIGVSSDDFSGIYLDACNGYTVEENELYSNYNPSFHGNTYARNYGLVINNSGTEDNFIYNNDFHNLGYACQAQEINRSNIGTGLTIHCNDFDENYQDIYVAASDTGSQYGIKEHQGLNSQEQTAPAGNTFSHISGTLNENSDYLNECEDIYYWHHKPIIGAPYVVPVYRTEETVDARMNDDITTFEKDSACRSNLESRSRSAIQSLIITNKSLENIYVDSLDLLVDDGNTTALNLDVSTSQPGETMELRDELLDASPYLSDTVMASAASKEDVLPNSIITEVLIANPQSAHADQVLDELNNRDNPPSESQMNTILANDTVIGKREMLESKKAYFSGKKAYAVYNLVNHFLNDTVFDHVHDSIENALTHIVSPTSSYQQALCRLNANDSAGLVSLLSTIPMDFELTETESDYHDYFEDYMALLYDLYKNDAIANDLDSASLTDVYAIMNHTDKLLHAYARNLLIYADGLEYHEPYLEADTSQVKSSGVIIRQVEDWDQPEEEFFRIYPNPANDYMVIEYQFTDYYAEPIVEIMYVTGIHVHTFRLFGQSGMKIIDLRDWQYGTYVLRLSNKGKTLQNEKFIKQ